MLQWLMRSDSLSCCISLVSFIGSSHLVIEPIAMIRLLNVECNKKFRKEKNLQRPQPTLLMAEHGGILIHSVSIFSLPFFYCCCCCWCWCCCCNYCISFFIFHITLHCSIILAWEQDSTHIIIPALIATFCNFAHNHLYLVEEKKKRMVRHCFLFMLHLYGVRCVFFFIAHMHCVCIRLQPDVWSTYRYSIHINVWTYFHSWHWFWIISFLLSIRKLSMGYGIRSEDSNREYGLFKSNCRFEDRKFALKYIKHLWKCPVSTDKCQIWSKTVSWCTANINFSSVEEIIHTIQCHHSYDLPILFFSSVL